MKTSRCSLTLSLLALLCWLPSACADDPAPVEPVGDAKPAVPDAPGDAGEGQPKPPGEGEAGKTDAPPAVETSQPNTTAVAAPAPGEMVVNVSHLNVRKGPGMKHAKVRLIKQGDRVKPTDCKGAWCQIGAEEFVARKYLSDAK